MKCRDCDMYDKNRQLNSVALILFCASLMLLFLFFALAVENKNLNERLEDRPVVEIAKLPDFYDQSEAIAAWEAANAQGMSATEFQQ